MLLENSSLAAVYQEQLLNNYHPDEAFDGGRFAFECMPTGNLQVFLFFCFKKHPDTLLAYGKQSVQSS